MTESVVLITGTSSGIGLSTAVQAARAGLRVVATMRNVDRSHSLREAAASAGVDVDIRPLEVTSADSIAACVDGVIADHGRVDAVVHNAGRGHVGTIERETTDDVRQVFETNFFSVVELTRQAMPHLRRTGGRILAVSSVGGIVGQPFNEAYCASKFAVEGWLESLAPVANTVGVAVTIIEPGAVRSEFVTHLGADRVVVAAGPYRDALDAYFERTGTAFDSDTAQTPDDVAAVIVDALTTATPPTRIQTSDFARRFAGVKLADLDGSAVQALTSGWVATTP